MNSKEFVDEELSLKLLSKAQSGDEQAAATLKWLSRFNNEFHKDLIRKGDKEALHSTDLLRKSCHKRNYDRRNDLFSCGNRVDINPASIDQEYWDMEYVSRKQKKTPSE